MKPKNEYAKGALAVLHCLEAIEKAKLAVDEVYTRIQFLSKHFEKEEEKKQ